jgi:hypothetical protein
VIYAAIRRATCLPELLPRKKHVVHYV